MNQKDTIDMFAAQAMAALITEPEWSGTGASLWDRIQGDEKYPTTEEAIAATAYKIAWAMWREREKRFQGGQ